MALAAAVAAAAAADASRASARSAANIALSATPTARSPAFSAAMMVAINRLSSFSMRLRTLSNAAVALASSFLRFSSWRRWRTARTDALVTWAPAVVSREPVLATGALLASDSPYSKNRVCTFTQGSAMGAVGSEL